MNPNHHGTMKNWTTLDDEKHSALWDYVYDVIGFDPHGREDAIISLEEPFALFDLKSFWGEGYREELVTDLELKTIALFQAITTEGERLHALDWQHEGYTFDPRLPFEVDAFNDWFVPAFPNGDYTFFLKSDLSGGIFGDGVHSSMTYWGKDVLNALHKHCPQMYDSCDKLLKLSEGRSQ